MALPRAAGGSVSDSGHTFNEGGTRTATSAFEHDFVIQPET